MGSFHGKRKFSTKKPSKPKGDSAEDIAARQARDDFIREMAAKAPPPPADVDTAGIHPSRLAMAAPTHGGRGGLSNRQGLPRGQRAPDLRQQNNKRSFEDSQGALNSEGPPKKQRTLQEIRKLKGPAAMQKEEEKRRKQALKAQEDVTSANTTTEPKPTADDDEANAPKSATRKSKTPEEKAQRKAEKAARKSAKMEVAKSSPDAAADAFQAAEESRAERKARRRAEKQASKADNTPAANDVSTETKEQRKERKRLAKAAAASDEPTSVEDKKEKEKRKKVKTTKQSDVREEAPNSLHSTATSKWSEAASALGSKSSKFLKLMGAAKGGDVPVSDSASKSQGSVKTARKAEAELEQQFTAGMQAKQFGSKRGGLGN